MGTISYDISRKLNSQGEGQIYFDILSDRKTHYRLKSGVFLSPDTFNRLIRSDRILSLEYFATFEEQLSKALPCSKEEAQRILDDVRGRDDDLIASFKAFYQSRVTEKGLTSGTQEMYLTTERALSEYTGGRPVSVRAINTAFLNGFIQFMTSKGLSNVTQLNYWRNFKVFLSYLAENGMIDQKLMLYRPKFRQADNDVIFLTHNELYRMYMYDFSGRKSYERIRDCFVVQCLTGLRFSDLPNIRKENIKEDVNGKYITLLTKKTLQRLKIYLNNTCSEILERYDWNLPVVSLDYYNDNLPEIAKIAGIDGDVELVKFVGTERIIEHKRKWEMIRSHTARRTFICQAIEAGVSTSIIRSITGHTQLSSFQRYASVGDRKKSEVGGLLEL